MKENWKVVPGEIGDEYPVIEDANGVPIRVQDHFSRIVASVNAMENLRALYHSGRLSDLDAFNGLESEVLKYEKAVGR
jgi:hypothetical protein